MIEQILNDGAFTSEGLAEQNAVDLVKAMEATLNTGRDFNNQEHAGGGLKVESLEGTLKTLTAKMENYKLWNTIPKERVFSTVNEYNQLVKYGEDVGVSNLEGETGEFTDSVYRRKSTEVAFMNVGGQVTHPAQLVRTQGSTNIFTQEVQNKTMLLIEQINKGLSVFNNTHVSTQFKGIFQQHFEGIVEIAGLSGGTFEQQLDAYYGDSVVIDLRGKALTQASVQEAMEAVVNDRYANPTRILGNSKVWSDFAKRDQDKQRINIGYPSAVENAVFGQSINKVVTQFGTLDIMNDLFFDNQKSVTSASVVTSAKAPAAPVPDGVTPQAVAADAKTQFTDGVGTYLYAVRAKNRWGMSAPVVISATPLAVAATESVDLNFTAGSGNYAAESFVIYRTEKDDTASSTSVKYHPIFEITASQLTAGYDGGAAGLVRDRNRIVANTTSSIIYEPISDILKYIELMPIMRVDYAPQTLSNRFSIVNYAAPQMAMPGKVARIINIGRDIT